MSSERAAFSRKRAPNSAEAGELADDQLLDLVGLDQDEEMLSRAERFLNTTRDQASRPAPPARAPEPPEPPRPSGAD